MDKYDQAVSEIGNHVFGLSIHRLTHGGAILAPSLVGQALVMTKDVLIINTVGQVVRWDIDVEGIEGFAPQSRAELVMACRNGLAMAKYLPIIICVGFL